MLLERRLNDHNYDSLTQSAKRKEEIKSDLTTSTKVREETKIDLNDVSITDTENINNDNNRSKTRSIYGDEESVTSNEDRITPISKKPIHPSYKDTCMNNTITCGRESITYGSKIGHNIATHPPPVTSE